MAVLGLAAVALLALPGLTRADFINGTFATGNLTGWTVFTTPNGSNGTLGGNPLPDVVSFDTTGTGASTSARFEVGEVNFDGTQQGGGIFQDVLGGAGTYHITGNFAASGDGTHHNAEAGVFSLLLDGVTVSSTDVGSINADQVIRGTFDVTLDLPAGEHEFRFEITRPFVTADGNTPFQYLTDLALTAPAAAVPEPSSLALFGLGAAGLAVWRRRRRT